MLVVDNVNGHIGKALYQPWDSCITSLSKKTHSSIDLKILITHLFEGPKAISNIGDLMIDYHVKIIHKTSRIQTLTNHLLDSTRSALTLDLVGDGHPLEHSDNSRTL